MPMVSMSLLIVVLIFAVREYFIDTIIFNYKSIKKHLKIINNVIKYIMINSLWW